MEMHYKTLELPAFVGLTDDRQLFYKEDNLACLSQAHT